MSQRQVAKALEVTDMTVSRYETGKQEIGLKTLRRLADIYGCRISDLVGETDYREATVSGGYASVPVYDIGVAAGIGTLVEDGEPVAYHLFMREFLRSISAGEVEHLALIRVAGDAMWNTVHDRDDILVDRSVTKLKRDGIYVLRAGQSDEFQVKRLQWQPDGLLSVISDNPAYRSYENIQPDQIQVLGRVIWIGKRT